MHTTSTPTQNPTPSRVSVRRGTALAVATLLAAGTGSFLSAPAAQARSQFGGCVFQVAKTDAAGNPLSGASFRVATADGSAKILTPAQATQVDVAFLRLVAPFSGLLDAARAGVGLPASFAFVADAGGNVPSLTLSDVQSSIDILSPFASAPTIPDSATAGFDTSAAVAFQAAIRTQVAAEKAFLAANSGVTDLTLNRAVVPTTGSGGTAVDWLYYGLGLAPASNPGPAASAPTINNPTTGPGVRPDTRRAIETGTSFILDLNTRPGGMLTLPAGVDFVSATNGAIYNPATRTITNVTGGMVTLLLRGTQVGQVNLTATDVALPGGPTPAGQYVSGTLTLNFMTPVSAIAPPPAVDLFGTPNPSLAAVVTRAAMIVAQENLPAPLVQQLAALKAPLEVASVTSATQPNGILTLAPTRAFSPGVAGATIIVDSGPAIGGTAVPVTITETVAPQGFQLDSRPQTIPVGFDSCAPVTSPAPAPGSPAWMVTKASGPLGLVETATLRDAAAAVVVAPPVVTPPVVVPPVAVVPPVVTPPVVVPPVAVVPPVVTPPVVVPPVEVTPPVPVPVAVVPVAPVPVATPAPAVPAPVAPVPVAPVAAPAPVIAPPAATAVPVAPAPQAAPITRVPQAAPQVTRVEVPRSVDAGLAPAAADTSSSTNTGGILTAVLAALGLTAAAGGVFARRRRS